LPATATIRWVREKLEQFANEQWLPTHVTPEQAAAIVRDQFQRTIAATMELLEVRVETQK
jgi:hypothetical protein